MLPVIFASDNIKASLSPVPLSFSHLRDFISFFKMKFDRVIHIFRHVKEDPESKFVFKGYKEQTYAWKCMKFHWIFLPLKKEKRDKGKGQKKEKRLRILRAGMSNI